MNQDTNTTDLTAVDAPFELPEAPALTEAQQKAADIKAEKEAQKAAKAAVKAEKAAAKAAAKAEKEAAKPAPKEPKLTVKEVVLAGLALQADSEANGTGKVPSDKDIVAQVNVLIPDNNCQSIAWYKNALKPAKGATEAKIKFLDEDGTTTQAKATYFEGVIPPKVVRRNAPKAKQTEAQAADADYAAKMDAWCEAQGMVPPFEMTPDMLAEFEATLVAEAAAE
jgi:hypothetical protein